MLQIRPIIMDPHAGTRLQAPSPDFCSIPCRLKSFNCQRANCPTQENGYDCGVHVLGHCSVQPLLQSVFWQYLAHQ